jgi:PAS domain S-box-containing protein
MHGSLSLRERMLVVTAAALLPLIAVVLWGAARDRQAAAELARSQLKFSASLLAAHQDRTVEAAEQLLGAIVSVPELRNAARASCQPYFQALRERYPAYTNIALFDPQGEPLCHALGESGANVHDRDYFRLALEERRFVIGEPVSGRVTGRAALPFAMPLLDKGKAVAVALVALDLERASQALARVDLPEGARVLVADRHAHVLMQFPPKTALMQPSIDGNVHEAARTMKASVGEARDANGEARLFAIAPTRLVGDQGFVVRVGLSRDVITRDVWVREREELAALAAVLLLAMGTVWWIGGHMIIKPAKQILGTAKRIEQGRLDARVPVHVIGTRNEFARLGAAFNLMADSLQLRQAGLAAELDRSRGAYAVLDQVLNSMQEGVIAVTTEGRFLIYNEAATRMFSLADAPVLPELWPAHFGVYHLDRETLYRAEDLSLVRATLGNAGRSQIFVRNALVPEGRILQCSAQPLHGGSLRGGLVVFTDLTQLQRLQFEQAAQLAQLEETQRKLIESQRIGRVGNWELDLRTGRLWWSQQVFELYGIGEEQFDGTLQGFEQRVLEEDRPKLKPARDRALLDGAVLELEYRIVRPDGTIAWVHEIAETRRDESGEPIWFGGVVQDITQRKQHEEAIRELNAGLESRIAERTAQLNESNQELEAFSYSVSHDLRAPLSAISGFSRALEGKVAPLADERATHYLTRIQAGVAKMEELIEALLQLSRVTRTQVQRSDVDLTALAHETAESLKLQQPGRAVTVRIEEGLCAQGDPRLLRAVFENLMGNAWKFTGTTPQPVIEVGRLQGQVFFVRDNGVGFDMAYVDKLFNAFHRLHRESEFPGTGIGLATVRRVIARHQGQVWAESQPGAGATFYFSLPDPA